MASENSPCFVEYELFFQTDGNYELWVEYASKDSRPIDVFLDGRLVVHQGFKNITGGWSEKDVKRFKEGTLGIKQPGKHILRLSSIEAIPHLRTITLQKINQGEIHAHINDSSS